MVVYPGVTDQGLLYIYCDDVTTVNGGSNAILPRWTVRGQFIPLWNCNWN